MAPNFFDEDVATVYDDDSDVRFTAAHLEIESGFLADLATSGGGAEPGGRPGRALELAIGTGRVALPLRARGVDVHGIDMSEAMVRQLRAKPGGADVPVVVGDFTTTRVPGEFDLVYLVYNTIGNVTSAEGQAATFVNAARHLRPGGSFVVETGVPGVQWLEAGERFRVFQHDESGVGIDEYDVVTQSMWSHHYSRAADGRFERWSMPFRYVWPAELDLMASTAGMRLSERWAWWDRSPFTATSESHVSVWTKLDS